VSSRETLTIERAIRDGLVTVSDPIPRYVGTRRLVDVRITEVETGDATVKTFASEEKALGWLASVWIGTHKPVRGVGRPRKTGNPVLDDDDEDDVPAGNFEMRDPEQPSNVYGGGTATRQARSGNGTVTGRVPKKFSLKPVKESLEAAGLDPTREIVRALTETEPVLSKAKDPETGELLPVVDILTGEIVMRPVLDARTRAVTNLALLEFVEPRKKAVEVTEVPNEKTLDEVDAAIKRIVGATLARRQPQEGSDGAAD